MRALSQPPRLVKHRTRRSFDSMTIPPYVIGVDVGTGSARAGLFDGSGSLLASAVEPIELWRPLPDHAEQSSDDIWRLVVKVVRASCRQAGVQASAVVGIGFDATCSLVVLDRANQPLAVNAEGDARRNVIVWMDRSPRWPKRRRSMPTAMTCCATSAAGSRPRWRRRNSNGSKRTCPRPGNRRASSSTWPIIWSIAPLESMPAACVPTSANGLTWGTKGDTVGGTRSFFVRSAWPICSPRTRWGATFDHWGHAWARSRRRRPTSSGCPPDAVSIGIIDAHAGGLGLLGTVWEGQAEPRPEQLESTWL